MKNRAANLDLFATHAVRRLPDTSTQYDLDLDEKCDDKNSSSCVWRYRLSRDALIEECDDRRYVYGLWDRLFGCWVEDCSTGGSQEILPNWPVLAESGLWLEAEKVSCAGKLAHTRYGSLRERAQAAAAFAMFFSTIPTSRRRLAAAFGDLQWLVLDLMAQEPTLAGRIEEWIAAGRVIEGADVLRRALRAGHNRRSRQKAARAVVSM